MSICWLTEKCKPALFCVTNDPIFIANLEFSRDCLNWQQPANNAIQGSEHQMNFAIFGSVRSSRSHKLCLVSVRLSLWWIFFRALNSFSPRSLLISLLAPIDFWRSLKYFVLLNKYLKCLEEDWSNLRQQRLESQESEFNLLDKMIRYL